MLLGARRTRHHPEPVACVSGDLALVHLLQRPGRWRSFRPSGTELSLPYSEPRSCWRSWLVLQDRSSASLRSRKQRRPKTADYVDYVRVVSGLEHIAAQSTAFIPDDVAESVSDSYRLFLSLMYGSKPVITGMFGIESFDVMRDMLLAVRGSAKELADILSSEDSRRTSNADRV